MRDHSARLLLLFALLVGSVSPALAGWEEGVAAFKAGNLSQAAKEFQAVVNQQPEWANGHFMLGQTLLLLDRNQEALSHLRKAYDLNPNDASIQLALGKAYLDNRRYSDAAALLRKINEASLPKEQQGKHQQMLAFALSKSGQSDAALGALEKSARANPNDAATQYAYGTAAFAAGDTQAALGALEKAARLAPRDAAKQRVYTQVLLRAAREANGSAKAQYYQKAAQAASALAQRDSSFDTLLLVGEAQLGAKQYDAAVSAFNQAAQKKSDWLPHFYIGQAYTAKGQYGPAEAALKQALTKTSSSSEQVRIWRQLGFVYEKQKSYDEATMAYQRAGDSASVARVRENQRIQEYNKDVEQENQKLEELEEERRRLEEELKQLPGGPPPPRF